MKPIPFLLSLVLLIALLLTKSCFRTSKEWHHVSDHRSTDTSIDTLVRTTWHKGRTKPKYASYSVDGKRLFLKKYSYLKGGDVVITQRRLQKPKWRDSNIYRYRSDGSLKGHIYVNRFAPDTLSYMYYRDGSVASEWYTETHGKQGRAVNYYSNGKLCSVVHFHHNRLITVDTILDLQGQPLPLGDFKYGEGKLLRYDCDGKPIGYDLYENGRRKKRVGKEEATD